MQVGEQTVIKPASQKLTRREKLLVNQDIKRWYDNIARGSRRRAINSLYYLDNFCKEHKITEMELAQLGMKDLRSVTDLLQDHITLMETRGNAPGYIQQVIESVKSWLSHFDVKVTRKLRISNIGSTPSLENERTPEAAEMSEINNRADLRTGTIISLLAKAGLRPEVLGNDDGTDGLAMKDLPDIVIQQGVARCLQSPCMIIVRKTLSKAKHQYFTFLTNQGTKRLLAYLNHRLANGEVLNAESPVIAPDFEHNYGRRSKKNNRFLTTHRISMVVKECFKPRFQWRPYVLRAYFDTQLLMAESRGKIARDFRVFFMGHIGNIEARYTTNKCILSQTLIDEMREAFKRSEEYLDLEIKEEDPLLKEKERLKQLIDKATPDKVQEMLSKLGICDSSRE